MSYMQSNCTSYNIQNNCILLYDTRGRVECTPALHALVVEVPWERPFPSPWSVHSDNAIHCIVTSFTCQTNVLLHPAPFNKLRRPSAPKHGEQGGGIREGRIGKESGAEGHLKGAILLSLPLQYWVIFTICTCG